MDENRSTNGKLKIGIVIALVLVLGAGVVAYATGVFGGASIGGDKGKVISAFTGIVDESYAYSEAALPGVGFKDIAKGFLDGNINLVIDAKVGGAELESMGMPSLGYNFSLYSNTKDKQAELGIGLNLAGAYDFNGTVSMIGKDAYLNAPFLTDKSFRFNLNTLGADLAANEMFIQNGGNAEEIKDISIDLFSEPSSINEYIADYKTKAKAELEGFVEALEVNKAVEQLNVESYEGGKALTTYDVILSGEATVKLMDKTVNYFEETFIEKMRSYGFPVDEIFDEPVEELQSEVEKFDTLTLKVVLDDSGRLVHVENVVAADETNPTKVFLSFLGKEFTIDKMNLKVIDEYNDEYLFDSVTTRDGDITKIVQKTSTDNADEFIDSIVEYNAKDMTVKMNYNGYDYYGEEQNFNMEFAIKDIVKGKSVTMEIVNFGVKGMYNDMNISGSYKFGIDSKAIKAPENSIEVLKLSTSEVEELMLELQGNVMQSIGPLMMMSGF